MIPDKIYIAPEAIEICHFDRKKSDSNVEYIRKDALLEWAKERYTSLDITQRDMWDGGYNYAMKELIEYLQSL